MKLLLETNPKDWEETCEKLCIKTTHGWRVKEGNCGLDVPIPETITIPPGQRGFKIHLGVRVQPDHHFWLISRSSVSKTPLRQSNPPGLIDSSYRGELVFVVDNISPAPFILRAGRRICQIVSMTGSQIYVEFGKVDKTARGAGGFGSTGTGEKIVAAKISEI